MDHDRYACDINKRDMQDLKKQIDQILIIVSKIGSIQSEKSKSDVAYIKEEVKRMVDLAGNEIRIQKT